MRWGAALRSVRAPGHRIDDGFGSFLAKFISFGGIFFPGGVRSICWASYWARMKQSSKVGQGLRFLLKHPCSPTMRIFSFRIASENSWSPCSSSRANKRAEASWRFFSVGRWHPGVQGRT